MSREVRLRMRTGYGRHRHTAEVTKVFLDATVARWPAHFTPDDLAKVSRVRECLDAIVAAQRLPWRIRGGVGREVLDLLACSPAPLTTRALTDLLGRSRVAVRNGAKLAATLGLVRETTVGGDPPLVAWELTEAGKAHLEEQSCGQ